MPNDLNNHDHIELLETALRRDVPPVEPWSPELQTRIVASIRAESDRLRRMLTLRRFAVGGALAAALLLAIGLLVMSRSTVDSPEPIVTKGADESIFAFVKISPAPVIVDDSIAAVEEFAANSVVQEIRYLARDASEIGSAMLAALPGDVVGDGRSRWWTGSIEK